VKPGNFAHHWRLPSYWNTSAFWESRHSPFLLVIIFLTFSIFLSSISFYYALTADINICACVHLAVGVVELIMDDDDHDDGSQTLGVNIQCSKCFFTQRQLCVSVIPNGKNSLLLTKPFMQLTDIYGSFLQQFTAIRMSDSVILVLSMWHNRSTTLNVTYIFGHVWFVRCNKLPAFLRRCNHFITALSLMCTDLHVDDGAAGPTRRSRHSSLKLKLARLLWTRPTKLRYSKYSANLFL